jgi:3'(2'), 5'-bisphosphate nucleotidase
MQAAPDDQALIDLASALAWQAAELILGIRARGFTTETKSDASPVTEADRAAELLIVAGLRAATPDIGVVAEEEISAGYAPPRAAAYWLIDPLDGTRDFVAGRDGFTVNIGLVRDARPVLGVVAVPASAELFGGIIGRGAWKRDQGGQRPIAARLPPASGLAVLCSRQKDHAPALDPYLHGRPAASIQQLGSALKFCRLAEGAADLYVRPGRTMEWDTAGPEAVLQAAGGSLLTLDGAILAYEKRGWANPGFVCRGAA